MASPELVYILGGSTPYFGPGNPDAGVLQANQGNSYFKHFAEVVKYVDQEMPTILEVGSWAGTSLNAWDVAAGYKANLIAVDSWVDYAPEIPEMMDALVTGDVERLFWHNMRTSGIEERLQVFKGDSRLILPTLPAESMDVVFIDGDHRYDYVKADLLNSIRLIRKGGVICGDDLWRPLHEVQDLVRCKANLNTGQRHVVDDDGMGYHPGVTTAVAEVFGRVERLDDRMWWVKK